MARKLFWRAKIDYDNGDYDWTIELSTATKVTTILAFDPQVAFSTKKHHLLFFLPHDPTYRYNHHF
jgi:hypothetical protein